MIARLFSAWRGAYQGIPRDVWFLALINLINRSGSMVIVFMTLYLTQSLDFTIEQAGYVLTFFGAGAFFGAYTGGWLTDRLGYLHVQFGSLVLNGITLVLISFVQSFWMMCAAVFMLSLIADTFRPANAIAIQRHSTTATRTRSISLYRMSVNLGFAFAPALGGLLASISWSWLFWVDGLTCIIAGIVLVLLIPYKKAVKTMSAEADRNSATPSTEIGPYSDVYFWFFLAFTLLGAMVFMQFIWTIPVYFKEVFQWSESRIGLMAALNGIIVFVVEMPLVNRIDGRRNHLSHVQTGLVLYALSYFMFLMPFGPLLAAILFIIALSVGEIFVMPFSTNFVFDRAGVRHAGKYMAFYTMAYSIANIVSPLLGTQVIARFGFEVLWVMLVAFALLSLVGFKLLERRIAMRVQAPELAA